MRKNQKMALYESIMKDVAKVVKRTLNEDEEFEFKRNENGSDGFIALCKKVQKNIDDNWNERFEKPLVVFVKTNKEDCYIHGDGSKKEIDGNMVEKVLGKLKKAQYNVFETADALFVCSYDDKHDLVDYCKKDDEMRVLLKGYLNTWC